MGKGSAAQQVPVPKARDVRSTREMRSRRECRRFCQQPKPWRAGRSVWHGCMSCRFVQKIAHVLSLPAPSFPEAAKKQYADLKAYPTQVRCSACPHEIEVRGQKETGRTKRVEIQSGVNLSSILRSDSLLVDANLVQVPPTAFDWTCAVRLTWRQLVRALNLFANIPNSVFEFSLVFSYFSGWSHQQASR
jgi:hypothetical protein